MTIPSSRSLILWISVFSITSPSADFGRLRKTSDFFGNLRKWSCRFQKSQHSQDKDLTPTSQKKLAGICFACSVRVFLLYEIDWRGIVLDVNSASSVSGFYCWKPASRENTPNMANYLRKFRLLIWKNFLLQVSSLSDRSRFCCIVELGS